MEIEAGFSTEMDFTNSQQRDARSLTVQNATTKMKLSLNEIQVSYNIFKPTLDKLERCINNQASLEDVYETMRSFRAYFKTVKDYTKTIEDSFEKQLGIILDVDYDRQLLCIENNCSPSSNRLISVQNLVHNDQEASCSKDPQKLDNIALPNKPFITPELSRNICTLGDEKAKAVPEETNGVSQCNSIDNDNNSRLKENAVQKFSNSYGSYDSSNDLPEAQAYILAVSKQTPDLPVSTPDSDKTASNEHGDPDRTEVNSVLVSNTEPKDVAEKNCLHENTNSKLESSEMNTGLMMESPSPALFEASQDDCPRENESSANGHENQNTDQPSETNADSKPETNEKAPNDSGSRLEGNEGKDSKNKMRKTKRRNEMDATSKKVNDWLNTSLPSENLSDGSASNEEAFQGSDGRGNNNDDGEYSPVSDDGKASKAADAVESEDNKSLVRANDDNDNFSTSTKVFFDNPDNSSKKGNKLVSTDEEIIDLSDDEIVATSVHVRKGSPGSKFIRHCKNDESIEVVDIEETGDNCIDNDDVCVIESSQESGKSSEIKTKARLAHIISESSESETKAKSLSGKNVSESKLTVAISDELFSSVATQEINSLMQDDEAKRTLLASSSSSSVASKGSQSEASDSDATVIIRKHKRFKKKKKRQELNKSLNQSEENSSDSESEINRLLNLETLRKRKRISGSSESCAESNSSRNSSDKIPRKKKKKKSKVDESEMDLFSDGDSPENNQNSEHDSDHFQSSPMNEPTNNDDVELHHRDMLLASESSSNSDEESSPSPEAELPKNRKKASPPATNLEDFDKENFLEEDCGKKKKKRKYDPLLHGNFALSDSGSEKNKDMSQDGKTHDQKYQWLIEKNKRKREASRKVLKENICNASDGEQSSESGESSSSRRENAEGPVNFVSCDPECVEISEDDSDEDDCTTIGYHEISSSSSENDDVQCIPQSQDTVASSKSGRKNIKKIISSKELTEESKKAVKEEEERRKRILEKEKLLSQTFSVPEVEKLILDFDKDTKQELVTVHPGLVAVLKDHQIDGVKFMWNTCFETVNLTKTTSGSGCVLAHCMGLGKSLQAVTLVHTIINHPELNVKTALILCPKSVVLNWADEFDKWLNRVEHLHANSKKVEIFDLAEFNEIHMKEKRLRHWQNTGGVMILSYATFRALLKPKNNVAQSLDVLHENIKKHLIDPGPDVIIFDEGHQLKNDSSEIHRAVDQVRTKRRIVLTGTPMQNNLMEYYFMVNLVKRNYLGDKKEFSNRFFNPINNGQFKDSTPQDVKIMKSRAHVLTKKMDGIVNRYDSSVIEKLLPKRYEFVLKLRLTELQINLYKSFIDSLKKEDGFAETQKEKNSRLLGNEKVLHYICNHPKVLKDSLAQSTTEEKLNVKSDWKKCLEGIDLDDVKLSSKTILFFEILQKCRENGDKLLVFSQQLKTLDLIEFFLKKASNTSSDFFQPNSSENKETWIHEKDYFRLDGKTHPVNRHKFCQVFNNPNNKRLRLGLLSTKAGGLGMNLIGANRAIIFDVSWNPSSDSQSVFRIYRFGQEKQCYVYRFVTKGTMEEKKYHRQVTKLSTSSRVVDKRQVSRHFHEGHLQKLYEYNFDYDENRSIPRVPPDNVLAELLLNSNCIENFEEHDYLLRNILDEELSEEDRRKAWEDYEREKNAPPPPPPALNANSGTPGPSGYSVLNETAAGINLGSTNFSTNYQRAYGQGLNASTMPPGYFNYFARNITDPEINYHTPNFLNNFQPVYNQGVSNAKNTGTAQGLPNYKNKEKTDLQKKVNHLLKNNIIPLPYEPLNKKPIFSDKAVAESVSKNKVSADKNAKKVCQPQVNPSNPLNLSQNPSQGTPGKKPVNPADASKQYSTSKKNTDQPGFAKPTILQTLVNGFFAENNSPSVSSAPSDKSVDPVENANDEKITVSDSSVNSVPTAHSAVDKSTLPAVEKTNPPAGNETAPPATDKTTPPMPSSTTTHPVDGAETATTSAQPSSLNTIIEDLKNFVKAKRNSDPDS